MSDQTVVAHPDFSILKLPIGPGDWRDADDRMFHACFVILGQFVEDELGTVAWKIGEEQSTMYRGYRLHSVGDLEPKAIDLWLWYRDELPKLQKEYADDIRECYAGPLVTEPVEGSGMVRVVSFGRTRKPKFPTDYPQTVMDQKLQDLMSIRRGLWT
jgi:hypothetical protein